ncbi:type II toxin-antitoxin system VapC family toxin [Floridanema aerugineum]|uniref:Type II toxin-antitoxin system VapC family toxin n=1 Tax=Floridaenema aerugineum BLCC-F46 TaxID=3153654 RepID=A0ABV4X651_9CYAN
MKIESALMGVSQIYLDTAPVIYYVQGVTPFFPVVDALFQEIERGSLGAIASPVTLTECLVLPIRIGDTALEQNFVDLLTNTEGITLANIDVAVGRLAADLEARYRLKLPDAFQIATALTAGCQAFLTNDAQLKRVTEVNVLVVDELEV